MFIISAVYCQFDVSILLVFYFLYHLEVVTWVLQSVIHREGLVFILDNSSFCMGYLSHTSVLSSLTQNEVWRYSSLFFLPFYLLITFLLGKTSFYGLSFLLRGSVGLVGWFVFVESVLFGGEATVAHIKELEQFHLHVLPLWSSASLSIAEVRSALRQHCGVP